MPVETEIDSAFERVRTMDQGRVVDVLKRPNATRVVREVCVLSSDVNKRKREIRIRKRSCESKEILAETEDRFVRQIRGGRPAPVDREVLRRAAGVYKVWRTRKDRTTAVGRIAEAALAALRVT